MSPGFSCGIGPDTDPHHTEAPSPQAPEIFPKKCSCSKVESARNPVEHARNSGEDAFCFLKDAPGILGPVFYSAEGAPSILHRVKSTLKDVPSILTRAKSTTQGVPDTLNAVSNALPLRKSRRQARTRAGDALELGSQHPQLRPGRRLPGPGR